MSERTIIVCDLCTGEVHHGNETSIGISGIVMHICPSCLDQPIAELRGTALDRAQRLQDERADYYVSAED